jgi:hypothetical protein
MEMGMFVYTDGDRWRETWHILNARINGYTLILPEYKSSISDFYYMYEQNGKTFVVVCRTNNECKKEYANLKKWIEEGTNNSTKLRYETTIGHCDPNSLISKLVRVENERNKNNMEWDLFYGLRSIS